MASPPLPDPERGVFETLLVVDGRPVELEAHLARLATSLGELYDGDGVDEARHLIVEGAQGLALGRLRLTASPNDDAGVSLAVTTQEVDARLVLHPDESPAALRSCVVPGGVGAHKWVDRSLLERLESEVGHGPHESLHRHSPREGPPPEVVPLLVDRDGAVLEAARANLFLARAGVLVTPPVDGRILPGTVGGRMVDIASALGLDVQESSFMKEDLIEADEVFLTGSVRGIVAVYDLDGTALQRKGEVTQRVTLEMRRRWLR